MSNRTIQSIDVRDLPEPAAAALQLVAEMLRRRTAEIRRPARKVTHDGLLQKAGSVKGPLTRVEIYEDAV